MNTQNEKEEFSYTYSAKEQDEVRKIREKYQPQEDDKMQQLRKLDAGVTQKATMTSILIGVIGALVMGSGMSLAMTDLGEAIGLYGLAGMIIGVIVGMIGIAIVCVAYPIYCKILKKEREKAAPEILRLTEELMK